MTTKTDLYLEYQKETGDALDTIARIAENNKPDVQDYIEWLEEKLLSLTTLELLTKDLI